MTRTFHWSLALIIIIVTASQPILAARPELKCRADGTFRIVMFSDTQDDEEMDPRTTALMEKVLDIEKPDLVIIAGDCTAGGACDTVDHVKQAIAHVAYPMEKRKIPWAITFGNHDQEHFPKTGLGKDKVIEIYASYPCNLNVRGDTTIHGAGNDVLVIKDSKGKQPVFCAWLIDSNEYAPKSIDGYDWIHANQVNWYYRTSRALEAKCGRKIPGVMFFHIPLREFAEMTAAGRFEGDRCEPEACSKRRSALFAAVRERGDVRGIFCGHDHTNNYIGEWHGVRLGYDAAAGYATYNLPDSDPRSKRTRGGRTLLIKEFDPWNFDTWMRFVDGNTGP